MHQPLLTTWSQHARTISPNQDNPIGGNGSIIIGSAQTSRNAYAILRDRFGNFAANSLNTRWDTLPPNGIVRASAGAVLLGEGIIEKMGPDGTTRVRAVDLTHMLADTIGVTVETTTYDSLRIMVFSPILGSLVRIDSLAISASDDTTLFVQGLRTDRLGPPQSGGWVNVSGDWFLSSAIHASPLPPDNRTQWGPFFPSDTGRGSITVGLPSGVTTTIPARFLPGAPYSIVIYRNGGNPSAAAVHPPAPAIADSIIAGTPYNLLHAKVFDRNGLWLSEYESDSAAAAAIFWRISPNLGTSLSGSPGASVSIGSTVAYRIVSVTVTLQSLAYVSHFYVLPGPAIHLVIEESATIRNRRDFDPLQQLIIQSNQLYRNAYAILRDNFGNFTGHSKNTIWSSSDSLIFLADTGLTTVGEGIAIRNANTGTALMIAVNPDLNVRDTVEVVINEIFYRSLRIYTVGSGPRYPDTFSVRTDETVALYAEGERSDGAGWDAVPVTWHKTDDLKSRGNPPAYSDRWAITPDSAGRGWVSISRQGATNDSIFAIFLPGLAGSMALYRAPGNPRNMSPYPPAPAMDTIAAGDTLPIVAKVFDRNGIWLSLYEAPLNEPYFSWEIERLWGSSQPEPLSSTRGHVAKFAPTRAHSAYAITTTLLKGSIYLTSRMIVYVKPAPVDHLVIEASPEIGGVALVNDSPVDRIDFGTHDSSSTVYAVLRDRFGNFVSFSDNTQWWSLDTAIVDAYEGSARLYGEGKVIRAGVLGQTQIVAMNRNNSVLIDTAYVYLNDYAFDSLRILVRDSVVIGQLVMRSDQDTVLLVQGKRSFDGLWIAVDGNWSFTSNQQAQNATSTFAWSFAPSDTGNGTIRVTLGTAIPGSIPVKIQPGLPRKLVLHSYEGPVPDPANPPLADPAQPIGAVAGIAFDLSAKLLDHQSVWLQDYEKDPTKSRLIRWYIEETPGYDSSGYLDEPIGHKRIFYPVKAYRRVFLIAELQTSATQRLRDTIALDIGPGEPSMLVLEASPDWQASPNAPNPIDTLLISGNARVASVYALLRDKFGNFVSFANVESWGVSDTTISVRKGTAQFGEGIISRLGADDTVAVFAIESSAKLIDSALVVLLPYSFSRLRIVVGNDTAANILTMNTNQDTTIRVQGLRSDTALWVDVHAIWQNEPHLTIISSAPGWSNRWSFSPAKPGTGWIRVSMGNNSASLPDTLAVTFSPGPPLRAQVDIITPPEKIIAGEPLSLIVKIFNRNGPVPGAWCFDSAQGGVLYHDTIGSSGRPAPYLLTGIDTIMIGHVPDTLYRNVQCFTEGADTVRTTLFYAPFDPDSIHQLFAALGPIETASRPFRLLPAQLDSLALEYFDGTALEDSVMLWYPSGSIVVFATGYDRFGNKRGPEPSTWRTDSTLHPVTRSSSTTRIVYDASLAFDNEWGYLRATAVAATPQPVSDSAVVIIYGRLTQLVKAITRDDNGNGYLDHIELHFSRQVSFPAQFRIPNLSISYKGTYLLTDSLVVSPEPDSVVVIKLNETPWIQTRTAQIPQTSWTPQITYGIMQELGIDAERGVSALDGAGPVVWRVEKLVESLENRKLDRVSVVLSEPVVRTADGGPLSSADYPSLLFFIWDRDESGNFYRVDTLLAGIDFIQEVIGDSVVVFLTVNSQDIAGRHFINFNTDSMHLIDRPGEHPRLENQRVKVTVISPPSRKIIGIPNPSVPTFRQVPAGTFQVRHEPQARRWVLQENAGMVLNFKLTLPSHNDVKIRCILKIYDRAGNLVIAGESKDLMAESKNTIRYNFDTAYDIDIYWNGSNGKGMRVAPGIYRITAAVDYYGSPNAAKYHDTQIIGTIGMGK